MGCSGCVKERQSAGQAGRASRFSDASLRGFASRDNTLTFALLSYLGKQFVPISTHHKEHPTNQSSLRLISRRISFSFTKHNTFLILPS